MLSNELVSRLQASREVPVISGRAASAALTAHSPPIELSVGLEVETRRGACWRIDAPVEELWPEQERWLAALAKRSPATSEEPHAEILALRHALPDRVVLVDVETLAAADSMIFLAGALHTHKGLPVVTQLLARSEYEEAAVLAALDEIVTDKDCLITFNGKSLDWPAVQERRAANKLGSEPWLTTMVHCDLLHHARRRWKSRLPNCKLQTLEQYVCGRHRPGDLAGCDMASAYQRFVERGSTRELTSILHHNAMDIITLWQLALWLAHA
jgi:uncharacterized protein YprB with RNaseH-like and TPR domain